MLAVNHLFVRTFDAVYGPYRKRWNSYLSLETSTGPVRAEMQDVRTAGLDVSSCHLRISAGEFLVTVPNQTKIETLSWFGWRPLWDGRRAPLVSISKPEFRVNASETVRIITNDGERVVFGVFEERPAFLPTLLPTATQVRGAFRWLLRTLESGALHGALASLLFFSNGINLSTLTPVEVAEQAPAPPIEVPVEVITQMQQAGEFNGHNIAANPTAPLTTAEKAEVETNKLEGLAAQISKISLPNIDSGNLVVSAVQKDGAAASLSARLATGKATSLSANMKKLSGGNLGERMKWSLHGDAARELSLKDQDQVVQLFRSLQPSFRACYDNALLKDEDLSVSVRYEAIVTASGELGTPGYSVVGRATALGERMLKECLTGVLSRAKVSKNLSGVKIRNEFVFRS